MFMQFAWQRDCEWKIRGVCAPECGTDFKTNLASFMRFCSP